MLLGIGVVLLFLIAACNGDGGDAIIGGAPTTPFIGGSQGLEISFLEGSPPDEVLDNNFFPFEAIVSLKNQGEFDLKKNKVKISLIGFSPADFGITTAARVAKLKDQKPDDDPVPRRRDAEGTIQEPLEILTQFPTSGGSFSYLNKIPGNTPFIFRADVCYQYQTKVVSELCVLEDLVGATDDAICDPSGSKNVFSSGSPVRVTGFRQSVAGQDRIQFSFDIEHSGSGFIFKQKLDTNGVTVLAPECPKTTTLRRESEDFVTVKVDTGLKDDGLKCSGLDPILTGAGDDTASASNAIKLIDGKRTITCTQELDDPRTDLIKTVDITLDFSYFDNVDKEVLVKKSIN